MATLSRDTSEQAEAVQVRILRAMPVWRRIQMADDLTNTCRELALAGLRSQFPHAGPEELRRRLTAIWLGRELATPAYGPDPEPPTIP